MEGLGRRGVAARWRELARQACRQASVRLQELVRRQRPAGCQAVAPPREMLTAASEGSLMRWRVGSGMSAVSFVRCIC